MVGAQVGKSFLIILCMAVQFCAFVWYTLSYIPFGQRLLKNCICKCCESV